MSTVSGSSRAAEPQRRAAAEAARQRAAENAHRPQTHGPCRTASGTPTALRNHIRALGSTAARATDVRGPVGLSPARGGNAIRAVGNVLHVSPEKVGKALQIAAKVGLRLGEAVKGRALGLLRHDKDSGPQVGNVSSRPSPARSRQLASKYAPIFFLHPKEQYLPADPDTFISNSSLRRHEHGTTLVERGSVRPGSLPSVRSLETFLDLADTKAARGGNPTDAPVLYQFEPGRPPTMTYWLFSAYNHKAINYSPDQSHEGDWERVTVVFGKGTHKEPTEMRYSAHNGGTSLPWSRAPKDEAGRPIVYVALGSHAMSPYLADQPTGKGSIDDNFAVCGQRFDSRTVRPDGANRLEDVTRQSWWGTKVRWGQFGNFPFTSGVSGPEPAGARGGGKGALDPTNHHARISLAERLAQSAIAHPVRSSESILKALRSLPAGRDLPAKLDVRDEVAQDFVEVLASREKLDNYARTAGGREVLRACARALESGSTHPDERNTYRKIQAALRPFGINLKNIRVDA